MIVKETSGNRTRYTDAVDLEAGLLTPLLWLGAYVLYRYRQYRLREMLVTNSGEEQATGSGFQRSSITHHSGLDPFRSRPVDLARPRRSF
jgi:hypothetical protein